jgi:hypothetical protein
MAREPVRSVIKPILIGSAQVNPFGASVAVGAAVGTSVGTTVAVVHAVNTKLKIIKTLKIEPSFFIFLLFSG